VHGKIANAATAALMQLADEIRTQLISQIDSFLIDTEIPQDSGHISAILFMQPDTDQAQLDIHLAVAVCVVNLDNPVLHGRFRLIIEVVA
jgi:hypothetical protein